MGRYVVVEFNSNADAEGFVDLLSEGVVKSGHTYRVVGLFARPGARCDCWDAGTVNYRDPTKQKNAAGVKRGPKFGWWVCSRCGKPRKAGHQLINLLKLSEVHELTSADESWDTQVDGLSITSIHTDQIGKRKKRLRIKKGS